MNEQEKAFMLYEGKTCDKCVIWCSDRNNGPCSFWQEILKIKMHDMQLYHPAKVFKRDTK